MTSFTPHHSQFDGEIVALDDRGRPVFNDRRLPAYVAVD